MVWGDTFRDLTFVLAWGLVVAGVYLLAADLSKETRKGTLNFLRMSPLSGRQILLGKLLGVPILLYLGVGAMLPLHLAMGLMSQYSVGVLLLFYSWLGAIALCFYTASLWVALLAKGLQGLQTWLMALLSFSFLWAGIMVEHTHLAVDWFYLFNPINSLADWTIVGSGGNTHLLFGQRGDFHGFSDLGWFFVPMGGDRFWIWAFAMANAAMLGTWFWVVLERKFLTPANTALGKQQSYGLTVCLAVLMLGFNLQSPAGVSRYWNTSEALWSYFITMLIWSVVLLFLLLPSKQMLLDWTRYRHQQPHPLNRNHTKSENLNSERSNRKRNSRHGLLTDLLYHDGSPFVFSYAVNMGIIAGVLLLGILFGNSAGTFSALNTFLSWLFCSMVFVVCALVVQWIVLSNLLHWPWVAFGSVAAIVAGWPIVLLMLGLDTYEGNPLWLMTAFPFSVMWKVDSLEILGVLAAQITLISSLSALLGRRCQVLGESEWKALMAGSRG
ncbi:MAG: hypothetical protein AAFY72_06490 [Cyanobacteria bacterium J06649_4]